MNKAMKLFPAPSQRAIHKFIVPSLCLKDRSKREITNSVSSSFYLQYTVLGR